MGMHAFRRLREQEAAAALSEAIASSPPVDTIEAGTYDQHPPTRRTRKGRASVATPTEEN
jgi:hypothetical protein